MILAFLVGCCPKLFGQCTTHAISSSNADSSNVAQHSAYSKQTNKLYVSGNFLEETFSFGGLEEDGLATEMGETTLFMMQFSKTGEIDWLNPVGQSFSLTYSGRMLPVEDGVVATFRFNDTVFVDNQYVADPEEQALVIKYNLNGDVVWSGHFESTGSTQAMGLAEDEDGNIYVAGMFTENVTIGNQTAQVSGDPQNLDAELFLAKFNAAGEASWLKYIGGGEGFDFTTCMTYAAGHLFISGFFSGDLEIGEDNFEATSNNNTFVSCTDTSGIVVWAEHLQSSRVRPTDMLIFNDQLVVSGFFKETLLIQQTTLNSSGNSDAVLLSFDLDGNLVRTKRFGGVDGDAIENLTLIGEGLLGVGGWSQSETFTVDGFNFLNPDLNPPHVNTNTFFAVCDTTFTITCFNYLESTFESAGFMEHVSADTVFLVGSYVSDLPIADTTLLTNGVSTFIAKTCMGCDDLIRLEVPNSSEPDDIALTLTPNPATENINIAISSALFNKATVFMTDILGKEVYRSDLTAQTSDINISHLPKGIYTVAVITEQGQRFSQKLMVQRP